MTTPTPQPAAVVAGHATTQPPTLREAAQAALDALESLQGGCTDSNDGTVEAITVWCPEVIEPLRAALAQPVPDAEPPVNYMTVQEIARNRGVDYNTLSSCIRMYLREHGAAAHPQQPVPDAPAEPVLQDIEQYRMQMAGISTAALGYWTEADGIHPDYDTVPLRDVAKLYAKYAALHAAAHPQPAPLTDEQIRPHVQRICRHHGILNGALEADLSVKFVELARILPAPTTDTKEA
jgi:transposase-like protein